MTREFYCMSIPVFGDFGDSDTINSFLSVLVDYLLSLFECHQDLLLLSQPECTVCFHYMQNTDFYFAPLV